MPGGGAVLAHPVRIALELNPEFVCVSTDVQNAHNAMARATVVRQLEAVPGLRHLLSTLPPPLESGGEVGTHTVQGMSQGDIAAGGLCCDGWHPHLLHQVWGAAPRGPNCYGAGWDTGGGRTMDAWILLLRGVHWL